MPYAISQEMEARIMTKDIKIVDQDPRLIAEVIAKAGGPPKRHAEANPVKRPRPDHDAVFREYNPAASEPIEQTVCIPIADVPPVSGV